MDHEHECDYKRLIICCDGTWQSSDSPSTVKGANVSSNVTKFCRALAKSAKLDHGRGEVQQVVYYQSGIGTHSLTKVSESIAGALGYGLAENVVEAYNFLSLNYEKGDQIFLFGFSRGAYTARSLAGLVSDIGIVDKIYMQCFPELYKSYQVGGKKGAEIYLEESPITIALDEPRPKIKVVGCWDTVGSLGVPDTFITRIWPFSKWKGTNEFHNTNLCDTIENAFQALALDEHRHPFSPALWNIPKTSKTNLVQCWFPGYHINVGGGSNDGFLDSPQGDHEQLADITFAWMVDLCQPFLEFDSKFMYIHQRHHRDRVQQQITSNISGWAAGKLVETFRGVQILGGSTTRTPGQYNLEISTVDGSNIKYVTNEYMHSSVRIRLETLGGEGISGWGIKRTSLKDFELEQDVDAGKDDKRSGWKWIKKLTSGDPIEIPEMRIKWENEGDSAERLLIDQDTLKEINKGTKKPAKLVDIS